MISTKYMLYVTDNTNISLNKLIVCTHTSNTSIGDKRSFNCKIKSAQCNKTVHYKETNKKYMLHFYTKIL